MTTSIRLSIGLKATGLRQVLLAGAESMQRKELVMYSGKQVLSLLVLVAAGVLIVLVAAGVWSDYWCGTNADLLRLIPRKVCLPR